MLQFLVRSILATCAVAATLSAQGGVSRVVGAPPPGAVEMVPPPPAPQTAPQAPAAKTPDKPGAAAPASSPEPLKLDSNMPFIVNDMPLTDMIEILTKQLHMKYILDKAVTGSVTIHTYGEVKPVELLPLLHTILRINGMTMVQVGDMWRIVPAASISSLPLEPMRDVDPKTLPDDERMILNLIFLKYTTAKEMDGLLGPFMGEHATHTAYDPANLLLIEDNSRSMKRTMELIAMFDSDTFANQRVRSYEITNSRPSDLAKDLEQVMKAYSVTEKSSIKFMAVDRINTLIAVAPNPGIFEEVQKWIAKLDIKAKVTAGTSSLWVYPLKYQRAEILAMAIEALYTGNTAALVAMSQMMNSNMYASGMGNNGTGYGGGGGSGMLTLNGASGFGMGMAGGGGYGMGGFGGMNYGNAYGGGSSLAGAGNQSGIMGGRDASGTYLVPGAQGAAPSTQKIPHVVPNPFNNTLLIQGTSEEYAQISEMLRQLDVAPRQVLIDAKIYEIDLNSDFAAGVQNTLSNLGKPGGLQLLQTAATSSTGLTLTTAAVVSTSRQLLSTLSASESRGLSRVISSPSIIATDGIAATMNVGSQVPVLTSQALQAGVQSGGSSVFTNTVSSQTTGVTLSITPHISSSGVVTMMVDQQVMSPQPPAASAAIQSPSFQNRSMATQLTIMDGDTVAIGGAILETYTESSGGVPLLHRIPLIGAAFGSKSNSKQRTELIIFLTPRVIYDSTQLLDATDELKANLKRVGRMMKGDQ